MAFMDDKEVCEILTVSSDKEYREFLNSSTADIAFIPEQYQNYKGPVMKGDAGNFSKWLHKKEPELKVEIFKAEGKLELHSADLWLPLAFLGTNITLPVYLNIVASYLYDRMKGSLLGEKKRVHMEAIYEDEKDGVVKKFSFEGDAETLKDTIKKLDLNKFLDN